MISSFIAPAITFLFRAVSVKFLYFTAIFGIVAVLIPVLIGYISPYLTGSPVVAINLLPAGIIYFIDVFEIDVGITMLMSAHVTRFMIRRLPVIG